MSPDRTETLSSGVLQLPSILAGTQATIPLPNDALSIQHPHECWLTVTFRQKDDKPWAKAGHAIAWSQDQLKQGSTSTPSPLPSLPQLSVSSTKLEYRISTTAVTVTFDRVRGHISSWTCHGLPLLSSDDPSTALLALDFWRAPTDNDAAWQTGEWKRYGLHMMTSRLKSFTLSRSESCPPCTSPSPDVDEEWQVSGPVKLTAHHALAPPSLAWYFDVKTTYTLTALPSSGYVAQDIHTHLTPHEGHPPNLPRVGHNIQLSPKYRHVRWFGLGPEESYNDKYRSQQLGVWDRRVEEMATHYEVPQENGNRYGVRWCRVSPASKNLDDIIATPATLTATSDTKTNINEQQQPTTTLTRKPVTRLPTLCATYKYSQGPDHTHLSTTTLNNKRHFHFSTQLYDASTLEEAKHPCDLLEPGKKRDGPLWRVDTDVAGVGTAACGPATLPEDQVACEEREWTIRLEMESEPEPEAESD